MVLPWSNGLWWRRPAVAAAAARSGATAALSLLPQRQLSVASVPAVEQTNPNTTAGATGVGGGAGGGVGAGLLPRDGVATEASVPSSRRSKPHPPPPPPSPPPSPPPQRRL